MFRESNHNRFAIKNKPDFIGKIKIKTSPRQVSQITEMKQNEVQETANTERARNLTPNHLDVPLKSLAEL